MFKTLHVAWREFTATVLTKGFLIGVLIVPLVALLAMPLAILLISSKPPAVKGTVAIIDRTGASGEAQAATRLAESLTTDAIAKRLGLDLTESIERAEKFVAENTESEQARAAMGTAKVAAGSAQVDAPQIEPVVLPADTDIEAAKKELLEGTVYDGSRLALIIVEPDAVRRAEGEEEFGGFEMFVKARLDARAQRLLSRQARDAIVDARIDASGGSPDEIRRLTRLETPTPLTVTEAGEKSSGELQQMMVPLAFMMLLWIAVFTGGQYLMTSTIEEKSNRVMEVLLSAVSPLQLMTGKILGQMSAGLLILVLYSGLGIGTLITMSRMDLIVWSNVLFLIIFFFLAFFMIASFMAAIGSAVTDIHEAQTLLTPVMLIVLTPMFLMMPIIWNPKSTLATVLSFIPPINPFVMILRLSSSDPPPMWQVFASIAVGILGVLVCLWGAAKVFRIGVLMYGKPPNLATLIKWIRMA